MDEKARGKFFIERMICEAGCFAFFMVGEKYTANQWFILFSYYEPI